MRAPVDFSLCKNKTPLQRGFTLIELLAVVATTGILAVLCVGVTQKAMDSASKVREINAARLLVGALHLSAQENDGRYLSGMDYRAGSNDYPVYKPDGGKAVGRAAQRYTFRIMPYLDNELDGTIFVNRNKAEIIKGTGGTGWKYDYEVSSYPALGMNVYCVGGVVYGDGSLMNEADCISRSANMKGSILAFASGGSGTGKTRMHGFCYVSPPTKENDSPICQKWDRPETWTRDKDPMNFGWVDFRYDGKAVCAFLDGSTRMCSVEELSDMRLWTRTALEANDPNLNLTP